MVSVGGVISGAFRTFRDHPFAVLVWALILIGMTAGSSVILLQPMAAGLGSSFGNPNQILGMLLPFYALMAVVWLVLGAASLRIVLRPEDSSVAGLRLGMDELRLLGLGLLIFFAFFALVLFLGIVFGIFSSILMIGAVSGGPPSTSGMVGIVIVVALMYVLILSVCIFFGIRFSLVNALTIARRKIIIGESWTLTRGNFWRLFAAYLVLIVLQIAVSLLAAAVSGPYLLTLIQGGFSAQALQQASEAQLAMQTQGVTPALILTWVVNGLISAAWFALWGGAVGTATESLIGPSVSDYATTFE